MKTSLVPAIAPDIDSKPNNQVQTFSSPLRRGTGGTLGVSSGLADAASLDAIAATSRMAGRLNAARISDKEVENWYRERAALLDKKMNGTMTKDESRRLQYARWTLDRIDDARYGFCLDSLQEAVIMQEQMVAKIDALMSELSELIRRKNE